MHSETDSFNGVSLYTTSDVVQSSSRRVLACTFFWISGCATCFELVYEVLVVPFGDVILTFYNAVACVGDLEQWRLLASRSTCLRVCFGYSRQLGFRLPGYPSQWKQRCTIK